MYRRVQEALKILDDILDHIRVAILSSDTRVMGTEATEAMALVDKALNILKGDGQQEAEYGRKVDLALTAAGLSALNGAWESAEKVALADSLDEMRIRVLDFKTNADYADAYLQAAIGWGEA